MNLEDDRVLLSLIMAVPCGAAGYIAASNMGGDFWESLALTATLAVPGFFGMYFANDERDG